jgi:DNA topoisomerase-1
VALYDGQYGPYVKHGTVSASIPKGTDPQSVTLAQAVDLIAGKAGRAPAGPKKRAAAPRKTAAVPKSAKAKLLKVAKVVKAKRRRR